MVGVKYTSVNEESKLFSVTKSAPSFLRISILMSVTEKSLFFIVAVVNIKMTISVTLTGDFELP